MHPAVMTTEATVESPAASENHELRAFRNVVRSLTGDAAKALEDLEGWCNDADQLERCHLLRHYLDYIARLCDGKA